MPNEIGSLFASMVAKASGAISTNVAARIGARRIA
jgi:hypothetical protein